MIESLLKLKCQQALAQGDYDSLSSYSQQLIMFQQGTLLGEMPIGEELKVLNKAVAQFESGDLPFSDLIKHFEQVYGEDLTKVGLYFLKCYNSAEMLVAINQ